MLARPWDALMLTAWVVIGLAHGVTTGPWRGRVASFVGVVASVLAFILLAPLTAVQIASRRSRFYMDAERTAVLTVTATRKGWRLDNHTSRRPGTGAGARLRALLAPELLDVANREGVPVYLDAATPDLARRYAKELDGLEDVGPALLRGRRMRRAPRVRARPDDGARP